MPRIGTRGTWIVVAVILLLYVLTNLLTVEFVDLLHPITITVQVVDEISSKPIEKGLVIVEREFADRQARHGRL
jgi:hypothetical protein